VIPPHHGFRRAAVDLADRVGFAGCSGGFRAVYLAFSFLVVCADAAPIRSVSSST